MTLTKKLALLFTFHMRAEAWFQTSLFQTSLFQTSLIARIATALNQSTYYEETTPYSCLPYGGITVCKCCWHAHIRIDTYIAMRRSIPKYDWH